MEIGHIQVAKRTLTGRTIQPPIYLIERVDGSKYLIHRGMGSEEEEHWSDIEIFEYQGAKYVRAVAECSSESDAILAIQTYWRVFETLHPETAQA